MGCVRDLIVVRAVYPHGQIFYYALSTEASPRSLPNSATRSGGRWMVFCRWSFFFFCFLLFSLSHKKCTSVLFSFCFSILVLKFFIAYFSHWPFWKSFWCFQFHHWITICHGLLFSNWSLFFWFQIFFPDSFLKVLLFLISSFNQSLCYFIFFNLALILLISFFFW